jgi:hypothetical protein
VKPIKVSPLVLVGLGVFIVWASSTNRLSLWSAELGAWIRGHTPIKWGT